MSAALLWAGAAVTSIPKTNTERAKKFASFMSNLVYECSWTLGEGIGAIVVNNCDGKLGLDNVFEEQVLLLNTLYFYRFTIIYIIIRLSK
jgi:hypothetical protein